MTGQLSEPVTGFAELHDDLRAVARRVLGATAPGEPQDWTPIAASGWPGLEVAAEFDGAAATFAEVAVVLREMGRALTRSPYASMAVLALPALAAVAPGAARDRLLRAAADGAAVPIVVAGGEAGPPWGRSGGFVPFRMERRDDAMYICGATEFVADITAATTLLIPAAEPDGSTVLVAVSPGAPGIAVAEQPILDGTRTVGAVRAEDAPIEAESVWRWADADPLRALFERAALATAIDSVGLAEAALDATVTHVRTREQFGRPVGSFQAVKHACADMLVALRIAGRLVDDAVAAHALGAADAWIAIARAKSHACAAAVDIAGKAMQLHGGMGYTWESGVHRYLERATLNRALFGSPADHRAHLARRYRDPGFTP
ncbi:acyl-CoA dehydrogenase [Nocardia nova]|uniref:Acyl-CoA dehydrogenase n=3 Tax=Nocardia TaxID=1817 RepID=A0A2T2ZAM2_9NOCA|nr:acyl-CoA dehydrogenase family protein [Nocardia nova]PSR64807.1 acyl-CoA dehydrogenase [Nocardia nova]